MKQAYIKPTAVVVAMEDSLLDTISNPDGRNGAPDNPNKPDVPQEGPGSTPSESKGHNPWYGAGSWDTWDDEDW